MNERRDSHRAHRMPFGQHRGKLLTELPNQYLIWLQTSDTAHAPWLIEALDALLVETQNEREREDTCSVGPEDDDGE